MTEANHFAKYLVALGLEVRTNVRYDEAGEPTRAYVALYGAPDQKRLFKLLEGKLDPDRRKAFEDLVLARGPIPDDILERMANSMRKPPQLAARMNELGVIAGMGGKCWTAKKVRVALAEYQRRAGEQNEAGSGG